MVNINEAYSFLFHILSESLGSCNFSTVAPIRVFSRDCVFVTMRRIVFQTLLLIFL